MRKNLLRSKKTSLWKFWSQKKLFLKSPLKIFLFRSDNANKGQFEFKNEIICEMPHVNISNSYSIISNIFQKQNFHLLIDNIRPNLIFEDENVKKIKIFLIFIKN